MKFAVFYSVFGETLLKTGCIKTDKETSSQAKKIVERFLSKKYPGKRIETEVKLQRGGVFKQWRS